MSAVIESKSTVAQPVSLLAKVASRYSVEPAKMLSTLKATAFKGDVSNEQMMALLIVADQYGLNPWTKEVYAFPDKNNGIVPVVGVDGWSRIINTHPEFDGLEFLDGPPSVATHLPEWIECVIHRKDRNHPIRAREYMTECKRGTGPWQSHPRRMLRHKALIQSARLAFGYTGIFDQDEAERIIEGDVRVMPNEAVDELNKRIEQRHAPDPLPLGEIIEMERTEVLEAPAPAASAVDKEEANAPRVTFAQIMDRINTAADVDQLDADASLIESIPALDQRKELTIAYRARRAELTGE